MRYVYKTAGTCSNGIEFDIEDGVVKNVVFKNGCEGNLKAIARFVDGLTPNEIETKCRGIVCGRRKTSCADQLALAVKKAEKENEQNPRL